MFKDRPHSLAQPGAGATGANPDIFRIASQDNRRFLQGIPLPINQSQKGLVVGFKPIHRLAQRFPRHLPFHVRMKRRAGRGLACPFHLFRVLRAQIAEGARPMAIGGAAMIITSPDGDFRQPLAERRVHAIAP